MKKILSIIFLIILLILPLTSVFAFTNGHAALVVIGQADFAHRSRNQGMDSPTASTLSSGLYLTFDSAGNLWVGDNNNERVLMYPKTSLMTNGPSAALVLGPVDFTHRVNQNGTNPDSSTLMGSSGLAFDSAGNLWVADLGNSRILMYPKASLMTNGASAAVVLGQVDFTHNSPFLDGTTTASTLYLPSNLAFDPVGNIWVADSENSRVIEYQSATVPEFPVVMLVLLVSVSSILIFSRIKNRLMY